MRSDRASWVALAGLALVLSGCGGDDQPVAVATVTETVQATATPTQIASPTPTAGPTSSPADDLTQPPTTYAAALAHVAAGTPEPGEVARFTTPTGNIYCALDVADTPAACELGEGKIDDPGACDPQGQTTLVGRIELDSGVPKAICNTDTIRLDGAPVLAYDSVATTRDTQCVSEQIGVTCVARNGNGAFFLSRGRYALLLP